MSPPVPPSLAATDPGAEPTATDRVYQSLYTAILEQRLVPGERLREEDLAAGFGVSRTVLRQALQRLAQDGLVDLQHNRGAQVAMPTRELAAQVFDARRVIECEVARRLGGCLSPAQQQTLHSLVLQESAADRRGDRGTAIRLSGSLHRSLAVWSGNPVFVRVLDELLPTTSLLMALYTSGTRPACVAHRHVELLDALADSGRAAAAEMRRHLLEIERSLQPGQPTRAPVPSRRDLFSAYRSEAWGDGAPKPAAVAAAPAERPVEPVLAAGPGLATGTGTGSHRLP